MFTTTSLSLRRLTGWTAPLLLCAAGMGTPGASQTILPVVSSLPAAVPHNETYGAPWQTTVSNRGDFLLFDFKSGGLYEYPVTGGAEVTIATPGAPIGGFTDSGIAVDPRNNNLYTNDNYNNGLLEFPFDAATGKWDLAPVQVANNLQGNLGGNCGNYYQSAGLSINDNGVIAIGTENGCGVGIFTVPIDAAGNFGAATAIVSNLKGRPKTIAIDNAGNISFNEDFPGTAGLLFIAAGTVGLNGETGIQVYFGSSTYNVQGVAADKRGDLYVSDANTGLMYVPLQTGYPDAAEMVVLSTTPASGGPAVDSQRGTLFMPIAASIGTGINDVAKFYVNRSEFGSLATNAGKPVAGGVTYSFASDTTPANFSLLQTGAVGAFALGDLSKCGISSVTDPQGNTTVKTTKYTAGMTCTLPVTFQPGVVGDVSAIAQMLDVKGNVINATTVHGTGLGSDATVLPGVESRTGSGLKVPSQVAVDGAGNVYVADTGLGAVVEFGSASATAVRIGKGLTAPTGVAVDGAGDVFIADSGTLFEVPNTPAGLNGAGQVTLKTGLGVHVQLATDAIGDLLVADPDNGRIVRLRSIVVSPVETDIPGFSQASAIAADGAGDVYVASGSNLVELSPQGQVNAVTTIPGATGLAVDASGSVYVTYGGQTVRIPNLGGQLKAASQSVLAGSATKPTSVAVDLSGNAYVIDAGAGNVDVVSVNGAAQFGSLATTSASTTRTVTLIDDGNLPLNVTGFSTTPDYAVTSNTCVGGAVGVGASCTATITFNPGPGDQGLLNAQLTAASDAVNAPVAINLSGTAAVLAASTTTATITAPTVTNTSVVVKVSPASGTTPVPTGNVTVTVSATGYSSVVLTQPLVNGTVTFTETAIPAGMDTFTVNYLGDRVYGTSSTTSKVAVGAGAILFSQPAASTVPAYALAAGTGTAEPYDGSQQPYYYVYQMTVKTANGAALVGTPIYDSNNKLTGYNYGTVSFTQAGGATVCAPVNVGADGTVLFQTSCVNIDTSNNQIPNIATPYTLTPVYSGPNYAAVSGTPFSYTALRNPSVIITADQNALTVAAGSTTVANLTITSLLGYGVTGVNSNLNNYSLPVELQCGALPAHTTCTFSYPTPDPSDANSTAVTPTTPGHVVMTLNTNVAVGTSANASLHPRSTLTFAGLFGLGMLGLALRRRRALSTHFGRLACLLLLCGATGALSSCGTANINPNPVLTTPAGSYMITVTAKQAGSKTVPNSVPGGAPIPVYGSGNQMSILFTMGVTVH